MKQDKELTVMLATVQKKSAIARSTVAYFTLEM